MKPFQNLAIILFAIASLSWAPIRHVGLLTEDFGVVMARDLAEEKERCPDLKPFPPEGGSCLQYWQCLSTKDFYIACDDISADFDGEDTASAVFWIRDGVNIHHYLTRRNFDLEACLEWRAEWENVLAGEDIVCLSGEFIDTDDHDDHPSSPRGSHYYWVIDRMKSRHREWSYFYREPVSRRAEQGG